MVLKDCQQERVTMKNGLLTEWNSLSNEVVTAPSVKAFEARLDNFWKDQPIKFNYKEEPASDLRSGQRGWFVLRPVYFDDDDDDDDEYLISVISHFHGNLMHRGGNRIYRLNVIIHNDYLQNAGSLTIFEDFFVQGQGLEVQGQGLVNWS